MSDYTDLWEENRATQAERPVRRLPDPGDLSVHDWAYEDGQRAHEAREEATKAVWVNGPDDRTPEELELARRSAARRFR